MYTCLEYQTLVKFDSTKFDSPVGRNGEKERKQKKEEKKEILSYIRTSVTIYLFE